MDNLIRYSARDDDGYRSNGLAYLVILRTASGPRLVFDRLQNMLNLFEQVEIQWLCRPFDTVPDLERVSGSYQRGRDIGILARELDSEL